MKKFCIALALVGCQRGEGTERPPAPEGYAADIGRICDVVKRSDADAEKGGRQVKIAMWLGANLQTQEARQFLVKIQPLEGERKAQALIAEAKQVGLDTCALAAEWQQP